METAIRTVVLVGGLVGMVVLFYVNLYVAQRYWLPAVVDGDDGEASE